MKKLVFILLLVLLVGCSDKPGNRDIEKQVTNNLLNKNGQDIFQIENFEKVNGFEKDNNTYTAVVKYDLVFKKGLDEMAEQLENDANGSLMGSVGKGFQLLGLRMQYGSFKAGFRVHKEENIDFIKTENGWRINQD